MPEMGLLICPRNMETLEIMLIEFSLLLLSSSNPTASQKIPFMKVTIRAEN